MANMMKEQCKLTQELRPNAQPESPAKGGNQTFTKTNGMQIPTLMFQFCSKQVESVLNKAQMKMIINVPEDKEDEEIKKKMKQMEDTLRSMKGVGSYGGVNNLDLCIFPGVRYPDKF